MFNQCQGEAGTRNPRMGWVQVGSAQGQGDEIQRNLRRQLGVEKGFRYTLMFLGGFAWGCGGYFETVFPVFCSAVCFVRFRTYVRLAFKVDSGGTN